MSIARFVLTVFAGLVFLFPAGAWLFPAAALAGAPTDQIKGTIEQVIRTVEDPALRQASMAEQRRAAIRKQAEALFDFAETAKRALGRHWPELSDVQQREFVSLFTDLLERSYIGRIEQYGGERIVYAGDSIEGDTATVRTKFITKQSTEIPVEYRLLRRGDRWLVYDVYVEGISLVSNYRTQFDRIMRTASYSELVRRMRANQADFAAPGAQPARPPRS
jgi:phospholipid transport system substrate-binding protein